MQDIEDPGKLLSQLEHGTEKRMRTPDDMVAWQRSTAYYDLIGFINGTSTAIQGIKLTDSVHVSEVMGNLCKIFDELEVIVKNNPPLQQPQRFGNKAYRGFARHMHRDIFLMLENALPKDKCHLLNELGQYISQSFGNSMRIDYGTGHELSFLFFLCALFKAKILDDTDIVAAALVLFNKYLIFVRCLQQTYNMEPAGSQGVWSLDDYQFVPFIWGSGQLSFKAPFEPSQFIEEDIRLKYKKDYMFISCIDYICHVKTGHFGEHSPQLWSITAVPTWAKINAGLMRMYQREVLAKYPIIQHAYFGELMQFEAVPPGTPLSMPRLGAMAAQHAYDSSKMPPPPPPSSFSTTRTKSVSISAEKPITEPIEEPSSDEATTASSSESIMKRPRSDRLSTLVTDQDNVFYPLPHKSVGDINLTAHAVTPSSTQSHQQLERNEDMPHEQRLHHLSFNKNVVVDKFEIASENQSLQ